MANRTNGWADAVEEGRFFVVVHHGRAVERVLHHGWVSTKHLLHFRILRLGLGALGPPWPVVAPLALVAVCAAGAVAASGLPSDVLASFAATVRVT